ncbi:hypothetical protein MKW94_009647 [Papaver nudicaule]|uniref:Uncharacterized protein n=1 Tax=Papaver nudicaule TaxID=74823 RepID=A0AA41SKI4_PAPNU|nr:hypothetical protein [Papaver nudicaule]
MESSVGFMTVFAVSGSVVLVALQAHKRLLSDFMKKVELELGTAAAASIPLCDEFCNSVPNEIEQSIVRNAKLILVSI